MGGHHEADVLHGEAQQKMEEVVTMDSGFCVSKGITSMEEEMGVYGQALVKKRGKYWSKGIPSNEIDAYFQQKQVKFSETLAVPFNGHPFFIHCTKEEKYITK